MAHLSTAPLSSSIMEIAHVLFMDIVAYSQRTIDEQQRAIEELQSAVRQTQEFLRVGGAGELLSLPTGDGMALVFFRDAEAPIRCAIEIAHALDGSNSFALRMGIHTGPVQRLEDINLNRNVAGGGVNLAQRVMDCGDAGHILVSGAVADILRQKQQWSEQLHDLGEAEVKHGLRIQVFNFYDGSVGNAQRPSRLHRPSQRRRRWPAMIATAVVLLALAGSALYLWRTKQAPVPKYDVVIADFANHTRDKEFEDALKQALIASLEQSPALNVLSEKRVVSVLQLMGRSAEQALTPDVAGEVCQRAGATAMLAGTIRNIGDKFVIQIQASKCENGDRLTSEQVMADSKAAVLGALDQAAEGLRRKLGESLASIREYSQPVALATTTSFPALQAYSEGEKAAAAKGDETAVPFFQKAIELDPKFAMAHLRLGMVYVNMGRSEEALANLQKAYDLRAQLTERERLAIEAHYYDSAVGDLEKATPVYEQWMQLYPRDPEAPADLGVNQCCMGDYNGCLSNTQKAIALLPDRAGFYTNLAGALISLDRYDDASAALSQMQQRNIDVPGQRLIWEYQLAFLRGDQAELTRVEGEFRARPFMALNLGELQSDTAAYHGQLAQAREFTGQAVQAGLHDGDKPGAAVAILLGALHEAESGNRDRALRIAKSAYDLAPDDKDVQTFAALAFARSGETETSAKLIAQLRAKYPQDTLLYRRWLPAAQAALELSRGNAKQAVTALETTLGFELAQVPPVMTGTAYPLYLRGEALLSLQQGQAAAAQFQAVLDHRGVVVNFPLYSLARLGLARSLAQTGDKTRARITYEEFFAAWQNADPDVPILVAARGEYDKLAR